MSEGITAEKLKEAKRILEESQRVEVADCGHEFLNPPHHPGQSVYRDPVKREFICANCLNDRYPGALSDWYENIK